MRWKIANEVRSAKLASASGIIVLFLKKAHKISRVLQFFSFLSRRVQLLYFPGGGGRAWYNGSYTMMAEPIRALELHYPMIQFLIIDLIHDTRHLCTCFKIAGIKAMSHGILGNRQVIKFAITRNRR